MATLAEIRAQYPQYADMPDTALADALHKKFYADIPRADFDVKIGLAPAARPQAPAPKKQQGRCTNAMPTHLHYYVNLIWCPRRA